MVSVLRQEWKRWWAQRYDASMTYEGYYSTAQTAEILELSLRQVRSLVFEGKLGAILGEDSHLHIPRRAVQERLQWRCSSSQSRMSVRELTETVQDLQYRLGRAEVRAEFAEGAESSLREDRYRSLPTWSGSVGAPTGPKRRPESYAGASKRPNALGGARSCSGPGHPQDAGRVWPLIGRYGSASFWKCNRAEVLYSRRFFTLW